MTVDDLSPEWRERYEERAAIIEEGCKVSRLVAEGMALLQIKNLMKRGDK